MKDAKDHFNGEKNGKIAGLKSNIVVSDAEEPNDHRMTGQLFPLPSLKVIVAPV